MPPPPKKKLKDVCKLEDGCYIKAAQLDICRNEMVFSGNLET